MKTCPQGLILQRLPQRIHSQPRRLLGASSCLTGKKLITMETAAINSNFSKQGTEKQALVFGGIVAMRLLSLTLSSPTLARPEAQHTSGPISEPIGPAHQSPTHQTGSHQLPCYTGSTFECGQKKHNSSQMWTQGWHSIQLPAGLLCLPQRVGPVAPTSLSSPLSCHQVQP